jgi:hypothetical protein
VFLIIYKGFGFNIILGIKPGIWKWSVLTGGSPGKTGETKTKPNAVVAAWRASVHALEPKRAHVATLARR